MTRGGDVMVRIKNTPRASAGGLRPAAPEQCPQRHVFGPPPVAPEQFPQRSGRRGRSEGVTVNNMDPRIE